MRIISPFQDVYDLQRTMFDNSAVWRRETSEVQVLAKPDEVLGYYFYATIADRNRRASRFRISVSPLFLAGEVHFLYTIIEGGDLPDATYDMIAPPVHDNYLTFNPEKCLAKLKELNVLNISTYSIPLGGDNLETRFEQIVYYIETEMKQHAKNQLAELRVPLAFVTDKVESSFAAKRKEFWNVSVNFCFNDLRLPWYQIEPNLYIMHQQLQQYIFGVLGTEQAEMVSTSDKDRLIAHGFDTVSSFRNMERS
jgi:hypothetical protein